MYGSCRQSFNQLDAFFCVRTGFHRGVEKEIETRQPTELFGMTKDPHGDCDIGTKQSNALNSSLHDPLPKLGAGVIDKVPA